MSRFTIERLGIGLLALVTIAVIIPIIAVIGVIVVQGLPAISAEFLFTAPRNGMRAGGIWPAIVGTFLLTMGTADLRRAVGRGDCHLPERVRAR